jgi:cytochrome o ubiquinol oxidase subunit 1
MKRCGVQRPTDGFRPIHMPKSTGAGLILAGLATALGFAMIWYIWWLAAVSFAGIIGYAIAHTFNYKRDFHIPAGTVVETEAARTRQLAAAGA